MDKPAPIKSNLFCIAAALIIVFLIPSQISDKVTADILGPRFIPYLGCGIVIVPNVIQLIQKLIANSKIQKNEVDGQGNKEKAAFADSVKAVISKYGIMILTLIMAFAATYIIEYLGYVITYCLLCTGMLACFKEKRWYFYLITYVLVVLIYFGFTKFLYVPLPSIL